MRLTRVLHNKCGGIAFLYDGVLTQPTVLDPKKATLANGQHPQDGEPVICAQCQRQVRVDEMVFAIDPEELH